MARLFDPYCVTILTTQLTTHSVAICRYYLSYIHVCIPDFCVPTFIYSEKHFHGDSVQNS
jgi:hypothetical protein